MMLSCLLVAALALSASALQVTGGMLKMRNAPSRTATVILYMPNGTTVDDFGNTSGEFRNIGSWGYLSGEQPGYTTYKTGWAMFAYLR